MALRLMAFWWYLRWQNDTTCMRRSEEHPRHEHGRRNQCAALLTNEDMGYAKAVQFWEVAPWPIAPACGASKREVCNS